MSQGSIITYRNSKTEIIIVLNHISKKEKSLKNHKNTPCQKGWFVVVYFRWVVSQTYYIQAPWSSG